MELSGVLSRIREVRAEAKQAGLDLPKALVMMSQSVEEAKKAIGNATYPDDGGDLKNRIYGLEVIEYDKIPDVEKRLAILYKLAAKEYKWIGPIPFVVQVAIDTPLHFFAKDIRHAANAL